MIPQSQGAGGSLIPTGTQLEKPKPGEEPKLVCDAFEHKFGDIEAGATVTHEFRFTNDGKGPLKIHQIRAACGCLVGSLESEGKQYDLGTPIPPGGKLTLRVKMNALWHAGEKQTFVDVLCNDPSMPPTSEAPFGHFKVHLSAKIVRSVEFQTEKGESIADQRVDLGSFRNDEPLKRVLILRNIKNEEVEILGVEPANDEMVPVTYERISPSTWRITVAPKPGCPYGLFLKPYTFRLKPDLPGTVLFVVGRARGILDIEPNLTNGLRLPGVVTKDAPSAGKITLKSDGPEIRISNLRLLNPVDFKLGPGRFVPKPEANPREFDPNLAKHLDLNVETQDGGKSVAIKVTMKPTFPTGFLHAMLCFETGVAGGPSELAIPVTGVSR